MGLHTAHHAWHRKLPVHLGPRNRVEGLLSICKPEQSKQAEEREVGRVVGEHPKQAQEAEKSETPLRQSFHFPS